MSRTRATGTKRSDSEGSSRESSEGSENARPTRGLLRSAGPAVRLRAEGVQALPKVGRPGDRYEREAESVARRVATGGDAGPISRIDSGAGAARGSREEDEERTQRQAIEEDEEDEPVQTQALDEEEEAVQRRATGDEEDEAVQRRPTHRARRSAASRAIRRRGAGRPMYAPTRRTLQRRMGADLRGVRIHDGPAARSASREMGARAFTRGRHIWLGPGASDRKVRLMAHEATHVVQQGSATRRSPKEDEEAPVQEQALEPEESEEEEQPVQGNWLVDSAWGAVTTVASAVQEFGEATLEAAADAIGEAFWTVLESVAPTLAEFARDVQESGGLLGLLRGLIEEQIGGLFESFTGEGSLVESLSEDFSGIVERIRGVMEGLAQGKCEPLFTAVGELKGAAEELVTAGWSQVVDFLEPVSDFFEDLKTKFNQPITVWIEDVGEAIWGGLKEVWDQIKGLGEDVQQGLDAVRETAGGILDNVLEVLGFGGGGSGDSGGGANGEASTGGSAGAQAARRSPEGASRIPVQAQDETEGARSGEGRAEPSYGGGIIGWINRTVDQAWEAVSGVLGEVVSPITSVVSTVKKVVSSDAITEFGKKASRFFDAAGQLAAMASSPSDIVQNQGELREAILPLAQTAIDGLRAGVRTVEKWIKSALKGLTAPIDTLFEAMRSVSILDGVADALSWIQTGATAVEGWAEDAVGTLLGLVDDGLGGLKSFVDPTLDVLFGLARLASDFVGGIRNLIADTWGRIPACLREIIKDFVVDQILARLPFFQQLQQAGDVISAVIGTVRTALMQIFVDGDLVGALHTVFDAVLRALGIPVEMVDSIIENARRVFTQIYTDPIGFLKNLGRALIRGFDLFFSAFPSHLMTGAKDWLFGKLGEAGIEPPQSLAMTEILGFVMEVAGLSLETIIRKFAEAAGLSKDRVDRLIEHIDKVIQVAGEGLRWLHEMVQEGPGALWSFLKDQLGNLWDMVLDGVVGWIQEKIIAKVVQKLVTSLDPTGIGAVVNIVLTVWDSIQAAIEYFNQMLGIVNRVFESAAALAEGVIDRAAQKLEGSLASALPVAIGFVAHQAGFSNLANRIGAMVEKVRAKVDAALDWLVEKTVGLVEKGIEAARWAIGAVTGKEKQKKSDRSEAREIVRDAMRGGIGRGALRALLAKLKRRKNLSEARLTRDDDVVLAGSPSETIEGETSRELRVSRDESGRATEKAQDGGLEGGGENVMTLGEMESQAPEVATVRGALQPHFESMGITDEDFPYAEVPPEAPRPRRVHATLTGMYRDPDDDTALPAGLRNSSMTVLVGNMGDLEARTYGESTGYEGGHLIGHQFGGPETFGNLVPQQGDAVNRGAYKSIENFVATNLEKVSGQQEADVEAEVEMTASTTYPSRVPISPRAAASALTGEVGKQTSQLKHTERTSSWTIPDVGPGDLEGLDEERFARLMGEDISSFRRFTRADSEDETDPLAGKPYQWQITAASGIYVAKHYPEDDGVGEVRVRRSEKTEAYARSREMREAASEDETVQIPSRIPASTRLSVRTRGLRKGDYESYAPSEGKNRSFEVRRDDSDKSDSDEGPTIFLEGSGPTGDGKGSAGSGSGRVDEKDRIDVTETFTLRG